jgi:hypothetical protein
MQSSLKLKTYDNPENLDLPNARALCHTLVNDIEKTHTYYQQQIEFIKQQYKIALRNLRPDIVSAATLRELFDEAEMIVNPDVEVTVEDNEAKAPNPKKKKKRSRRSLTTCRVRSSNTISKKARKPASPTGRLSLPWVMMSSWS